MTHETTDTATDRAGMAQPEGTGQRGAQPAPATPSRRMSAETVDRITAIGSPVALLVVWELVIRAGFFDVNFFPAPSAILGRTVELLKEGEVIDHTVVSLRRLCLGFLVGSVPALILGLAMGLYRPVRAALEPLIAATYPIPKSAILPLLLLIFGLGEGSKIAMVAIGVFFPVVINTCAGVREIDKIYHDVGQNFGVTRWHKFRSIALPGALPLIMTGLQLGIGLGLILIVLAEMIGGKDGLGYMIWNSWQLFQVEDMYVGLIVISVLGLVLSLALKELERILIPWRRRS
jgi:ABC-type nitrate/sulfonate/bicarbonate transport system permease component